MSCAMHMSYLRFSRLNRLIMLYPTQPLSIY